MVKVHPLSYETIIGWIKAGRPFTLTRYGDGEWNAICHGRRTKNGDGHSLRNRLMRQRLVDSILQPGQAENYYRGLWLDGAGQPVEPLARRWIPSKAPDLTWWDGLAIHFANVEGRNYPYFQIMRNPPMPVVIIGPAHLRALPSAGAFQYAGFVEVPYRTAWQARQRIYAEAMAFKPPVIYSVHAGPPSPVFAWWLWQARGDTCMILDTGSLLDGYVSKKYGGGVEGARPLTRKFWRKWATREILQRNLQGGKRV